MATYYTNWSKSNSSSPNGEKYVVNNKEVTYYNDVRYKFIVKETINSSNNTSTFVVDKYVVFYYTWDDNIHTLSVTLKSKIPNSADYKSESKTINSSKSSSGYVYVGQDSFTIKHNDEGTGSTTFTGLGTYTGGSGTVYTRSVSRTLSMTTINRSSSITSNATSNTKFGDTITFSITRYNSKFTHDIKYSMYNASGTIATGVATSQNWTIPTDLVASTPDNAQPTITITCTTKNGSTVVGSSTYSFKCKVPDTYQPTCSLSLEDVGIVPESWGVYVKSKSSIKGTITASGSEGSTIKSYVSKANDEIFSVNPFTTNFLKYDGERTVTTTVTDSRGRSVSDSQTIKVVDYSTATISMCKVERCNADGTLNEEGTYGKATAEYKISPINNLNEKILKVSYGATTKEVTLTDYEGTYTFTELFEGLETNASYNFEFMIKDTFEEIPQIYILAPSFVTISKLAGGRGVTFGQVATEEGLHSYMDTNFHKNSKVKNISINGLKTEKYQGGWITYAEDET